MFFSLFKLWHPHLLIKVILHLSSLQWLVLAKVKVSCLPADKHVLEPCNQQLWHYQQTHTQKLALSALTRTSQWISHPYLCVLVWISLCNDLSQNSGQLVRWVIGMYWAACWTKFRATPRCSARSGSPCCSSSASWSFARQPTRFLMSSTTQKMIFILVNT